MTSEPGVRSTAQLLWPGAAVAACLGLAAMLCSAGAGATAPAQPDLVVKTLSGQDFDLAAQRGHVVLMHFWATWCAPCRAEMPVLDAFYRRNRDKGLEVIAVSVDRGRDLRQVRDMAKAFSFPAAMLREASRNDFGPQNELPVTYVIDADGRVRDTMRPPDGVVTDANLAKIVQPLLSAH